MNGEGKDITSPTLDLKDFIGLDFATYVDGKIYGLPDQQFANLYWFRYDWFTRPDIKWPMTGPVDRPNYTRRSTVTMPSLQ